MRNKNPDIESKREINFATQIDDNEDENKIMWINPLERFSIQHGKWSRNYFGFGLVLVILQSERKTDEGLAA